MKVLCRPVDCSRHFTLLFFFSHLYFPASGQAVVTGVVPSSPRFLPSIFIARRVQQSHCSSIFHRVLLAHAVALSASQFVHKKMSQRIYTSMHSTGLELTKLTYTRLDDNLIRHRRHRGDRLSPLWSSTRTCTQNVNELMSCCVTAIQTLTKPHLAASYSQLPA